MIFTLVRDLILIKLCGHAVYLPIFCRQNPQFGHQPRLLRSQPLLLCENADYNYTIDFCLLHHSPKCQCGFTCVRIHTHTQTHRHGAKRRSYNTTAVAYTVVSVVCMLAVLLTLNAMVVLKFKFSNAKKSVFK